MPLNDQDIRALTYLAQRIRSTTYGAGPWDQDGTIANLHKLEARSLAHVADLVIKHAADPKAKTPGVLLGSYAPKELAPEARVTRNPRRDEACRRCGGWKGDCACTREHLADDDTPTGPPMDRDTALQAARAALVAAKHTEPDAEEEASA